MGMPKTLKAIRNFIAEFKEYTPKTAEEFSRLSKEDIDKMSRKEVEINMIACLQRMNDSADEILASSKRCSAMMSEVIKIYTEVINLKKENQDEHARTS